MCGITGGVLFGNKPFDLQVLARMNGVITHRGPDDNGLHVDGSVGLGFSRLSILDLSACGHQPMSAAGERYWIVFNGEIYNFEILRLELEKEGIVFKSRSDTEVILQLYIKYGIQSFSHLRGMFAIAIWDRQKNRLVLARDRVGEKPLYYYHDRERLLFASELKSIYCFPGIDLGINAASLSEYFSYGFIAAPRTIFNLVAKLEPGHFLTIDPSGNMDSASYWDWLPPEKPITASLVEASQLVFDKVDECIKMRMRSDVPLGAFLSGGIDSTIVVARMAEHSADPVKTFTIGFREKAYDESEYAGIVAERYGTDHHVEMVDPDYAGLIERIVSNFDEPFGDSSALPTYVVSEMIGKHVTVALSGDGGDEVFGGYEIYKESLDHRKFDRVPGLIKASARLLDRVYPETLPGRNYLRRFSIIDPYERFIERYKLISDPERKKLLGAIPFFETSIFKAIHFDRLKRETPFLSALQYNDLKHYLEGDILVKVDRMTMLHSIESRAPFLDHELIELAFSLPSQLMVHKGQKKFLLKEAFRKYIPTELFNRPKKGFSVPLASWFRTDLRPYFEEMVFNMEMDESGWIDLAFVRRILNIHLSKKRDLSFHLWLILSFAIWYRKVFLQIGKKTGRTAATVLQ